MRDFKHQTIEEILNSSTAEQRIIWEQLLLITGENCAIRRLQYTGVIVGSEFAAYFATKLYLALEIQTTVDTNASNLAGGTIFYDRSNTAYFWENNNLIYWNTTAATVGFKTNTCKTRNMIFSRINTVGHTHMNFIGYRIIY